MKTKYKNFYKSLILLFLWMGVFSSCEDYLDKAPEVEITESEVFSSFESFQGYLEDVYQCVPDETLNTSAEANWNFGDDVICTFTQSLDYNFDRGNYWHWTSVSRSHFAGNLNNNNNSAKGVKGWWQGGWYGIRKCNIALAHLDDLKDATQEQKDILAGQAYFFRALFHHEILRAWGGIAYIDSVYAPSDIIRVPFLTYRETAERVSADFAKAAQLLPADWDETQVGLATKGFNAGRATKLAAYGYLGKNLLYAASPLMNGVETGDYVYDTDLSRRAADAFLEVIKLVNQGYSGLEDWANYYRSFYNLQRNVPALSKEVLFNNPVYQVYKRWDYGDFFLTALGAWGTFSAPTQNYVERFGMANGLSIDESDSGFDPSNPWVNRDPRFYYNIEYDGVRIVQKYENVDTYAQYYTGGRHRDSKNSLTGYGYKKFKHVTCNKYDNGWANVYGYENPDLRLADVYLMYAEAVNEAYGPTGSAQGGPTAVEAVNIIRNRAQLPDVDSRYYATKEKFREFLRDERAVELAFEGHRWHDLRRWYIAHLPEYREKYALDFDKNHTYFNRTLFITRVFDPKHYWLPFPTDQVNLYPEFKQNPGW